jgi:acyl-coenzyme A synthetase/AMP-(fatty) acid ligase
MNGVDVCVIDVDTHAHLEESKLGILAIRGENITKGYINDPIATQKAFTRDGWLISGDMALIQDGYIYIYGRADDILNVCGEKISPLEIEHVLNRHEAIETSGVWRA